MTYLEAVNGVLKRLRENTVSTVTETRYSTLIGELVNEVKREVEDSWRWIALNGTIQATTSDTNYRYNLTGLGDGFTVKQVYDATNNRHLKIAETNWLTDQFAQDSPSTGEPFYFDFAGVDDSTGDYQIDLYPIPNAVFTINIDVFKNQGDLTSGSTEIWVPSYPVLLGAYYRAVVERGEDGGMQAAEAYRHYQNALGDAIALDDKRVISGKNDWYVM